MNRRTFVGILIILWGISFLIPFPIGKIALGLVFCYIGYMIIFGKKDNFFKNVVCKKNINAKDNVFTTSETKCEDKGDYNVIFGSCDYVIDNDSQDCEINVVFGSADINILTERPIEIKAEAVFSTINLPNGNRISFGDSIYKAGGIGEPLTVKVSSVFASVDIRKI